MNQWYYTHLVKRLADSERRYAELLAIAVLISEARADSDTDNETKLWDKLKAAIEKHEKESE